MYIQYKKKKYVVFNISSRKSTLWRLASWLFCLKSNCFWCYYIVFSFDGKATVWTTCVLLYLLVAFLQTDNDLLCLVCDGNSSSSTSLFSCRNVYWCSSTPFLYPWPFQVWLILFSLRVFSICFIQSFVSICYSSVL